MSAQFATLPRVHSAHDSSLPDEYCVVPEEFSERHIDAFIGELADSDNPALLLADYGICDMHAYDTGFILRDLARTWLKDQIKVHEALGTYFHRVMKQAALEQFHRK